MSGKQLRGSRSSTALAVFAVAVFVLLCCCVLAVTAQQPLPSGMRINPNTITISGISAGAAMAIQVEFAFANTVKAAGIIAGVPYGCSQGTIAGAYVCMDDPELISLPALMGQAQLASKLGANDPWQSILNHTITMFSGTVDTVVSHGTMLVVAQQYAYLGQPAARRVGFFNYSAEHAWITNNYGNHCNYLGSPYMNNCGLDFAGVMLRRNFEALGVAFNATRGTFRPENMHQFNQYYYGASSQFSLDSVGFAYVPSQCLSGAVRCHLHINFHGCDQYRALVGSMYVDNTGLNEWAESNDVVVLYPQTIASAVMPLNPKGCFDWWGYAGLSWANKSGPQMKFIGALMQTMTGLQP